MEYAQKIEVLFGGSRKSQFIIPLYQRTYAWDIDNCKRLFDDIIKIHRRGLPSHFFGSIVSVRDNEIDDDLLIIDGQQRITTVSIIILALQNAVKNNDAIGDLAIIEDRAKDYLYAKYKQGVERKIRLKPIESDIKAYDALFTNDKSQFVAEKGITNNYLFFYEQIKNCGITADELFDALEKLVVIDLRLDSSDNPQLIFESLNSTGKDLTEADKVRNYLLMSLTREKQEEYYHQYWQKIEECTDSEPTMFFRDYLTIHLRRICNINNIYFDFKDYDESNGIERKALFEDLLKYAQYYYTISKGKSGNEKIDRKLLQLSSLNSNVAMPFYLMFLNYAKENNISEQEIFDVLDVTENYWARRIICEKPANTLQKLYATLHTDIMRIYATHEKRGVPLNASYLEVMKYVMLNKQGNAEFPKDDEVRANFPKRQVYKIPSDYRCFLFERLENENSREGDKPVVEELKNGKASIEHIMPQTLTHEWKTELGDDWQQVYDNYIHTFANLTLSAYNNDYSNLSFQEKKKTRYDKDGNKVFGYNESKYNLSDYLKKVEKWTEHEIIDRGNILLNKFLGLWPMISSSYTPLEKEEEPVPFSDDEFELTGRKISSFEYKGEKHVVNSWKDMLITLCKLIYEEDPVSFAYICHENNYVHDNNALGCAKVAENCYVYTDCSTATKRAGIKYIFNDMGISEMDLILNLVPIKDED